MSIAAPNCCHRTVRNVVSIGCSAISFPPLFFLSHRLPPKAVKRCPQIGYRAMQRRVEGGERTGDVPDELLERCAVRMPLAKACTKPLLRLHCEGTVSKASGTRS